MNRQKTEKIFIFRRPGQMAVPAGFSRDARLGDGVEFSGQIERDFGAFIEDRLFSASDPDGNGPFSVLLLPDNAPPLSDNTQPLSDNAQPLSDNAPPLPGAYRWEPLRSLIHGFSYNRALRMYHLAQWREESRFCGNCGHPNTDAGHGEYAQICPRCGRKEFPRISPAILVLVKNERGEVLLAHNNNFKDNVYSLIAGFMEAGENLENTVAREVREEVGLEIDSVTFVTSQSWPFPNSLMVGFEARYKSGVIRCDQKEIADAKWFSRANLPELPGKGSVSRFIIDKWAGEADSNRCAV
ncbi:MAG: NAD(+) diphosphatase [Spirochaetaceae bacterium]|nr:NAD(+) diphosphatase [Spirochaetaceae bacterium]